MRFFKPYYHLYLKSLSIKKREDKFVKMPEYARDILRNLSKFIINEYRGIVLLPTFICDVVPEVFISAGLIVEYYSSRNPYQIEPSYILEDTSIQNVALLIINYFGMQQPIDDLVAICKVRNILLLVDNSQCYYREEHLRDNVISFSSMRKFYYGGTAMVSCSTRYLTDMVMNQNYINTPKLKKIVNSFINKEKVLQILAEKYHMCKDLFLPYLDDGFILSEDVIPIGIPLRFREGKHLSGHNDYCYQWPNYYLKCEGKKINVFSIHAINGRKGVEKKLLKLIHDGVI